MNIRAVKFGVGSQWRVGGLYSPLRFGAQPAVPDLEWWEIEARDAAALDPPPGEEETEAGRRLAKRR